ncbi:MAG: pyrimidine-nucleoside phosphorylase [Mollicutes bacterium]|nr:pyrimidine-nucleoside phosphorylase [Mollicutes bacterium]MDD7264507.1 pyrimidine-nucleoside phosphorylase [bacterium]MDY4979722.1 pyrimidine-nucleoside phosphorylase [Candidatus Onthovivens sp.]
MEEIIEHKRDGLKLTRDEIHFFIENYVSGSIPDYQASALLMAIYLKGMDAEETAILTLEMENSGEIWDLSDIPGLKIDKHSTGGVGDKVSLVLGPMVASCGGKLAKMSGRGLGHTGGTLDKLESIPGFDIYENIHEFKEQIRNVGMAIIGQSSDLDPADKKLYALRDVTATVSCIPLIASSIMSKKLASGSDCILLDVKYGCGAFMKTKEKAHELADLMIDIGKHLGKDVRAEVTDMDQPLGFAVGNNLEVKEAINTLKGHGPKDLFNLCVNSGSIMLTQAKLFKTTEEAKEAILENVKNGKAFEKFVEFVKAQKGDTSYILNPDKFEMAKNIVPIYSDKEGIIKRIDALTIGKCAMKLGGGREVITDVINMSAGIVLNKKIGDKVEKGELLCTLYTNKNEYSEIESETKNAFIF